MYCKKCGLRISDDSAFCQYCGESLEIEKPKKTVNYYPEHENLGNQTQSMPVAETMSNTAPAISEEEAAKLVRGIKVKNFFKGLVKTGLIIILIAAVAVAGYFGYKKLNNDTGFTFSSLFRIGESVTYANFEKIKEGMSYEEVVDIFGGKKGQILSESNFLDATTIVYYWYDSTEVANCNVEFLNGKVVGKAQIGLK